MLHLFTRVNVSNLQRLSNLHMSFSRPNSWLLHLASKRFSVQAEKPQPTALQKHENRRDVMLEISNSCQTTHTMSLGMKCAAEKDNTIS